MRSESTLAHGAATMSAPVFLPVRPDVQGADVPIADFIELFCNRRKGRGSKTPTTMQALRCFSGLPFLH